MMHMHLETLASVTEQAIWVFPGPETAKTYCVPLGSKV